MRLYVTDKAGNVSSAIPSTWTMDRVAPPAPSITGSPANPTASTTATFSFSDTEPGVTFLCALDGGAASACATGKTYTGLADGAHTFAVTAVDVAGNTSTATSATPWTLDSTSPVNTATFPVSGTTCRTATYNAGCSTGGGDLCGTTSDAVAIVSQVRVSIQQVSGGLYWNGSGFASATESLRTPTGTTSWSLALTAASMADGSYTVRTHATDAVGNIEHDDDHLHHGHAAAAGADDHGLPLGDDHVLDRELHVQRLRGGSDVLVQPWTAAPRWPAPARRSTAL